MAFVCAGTAALHPSMRLLVLPQTSNAERPLGPLRVLGMSLALALPVAAALWNQSDRVGDVVVVAVFASATIGLVLFRTYRAVNNAVRSEEFIRMQSIHDPLTGLKNRSWLIQNLSETMSADPEAETGLLLIDLDHFKYVNDTYGYAIGDQVLVAVARRLQEFAPESARLVHLGTDEFAITFVVDEPSEPDRLAAGILRALAEPFALDSLEIFIGASIGISSGAQLRATALDLLREADTAMYRAKAAGRNCGVWFDQSMSVHASQRLELETALRRALERNEFEVYYQPIVNLRDSSWRGVEALVRWNRPGTGLVSPAEFIPVAEETGLIVELGTWVLREAIRQVAEWRNEFGVQWAVSINVSPRQLKDPHAVEAIIGELRRGEIPWGSLWLELTEGLLIENDQHAKAQLEHLRHAGACIVVDDFGTGYSSLSYLQRFPIDRVKIDKSFTMSLGEDAESAAIVRAVLGMANALGLDAVAEGVETDEQRRRLIELGCGVGQGFLFSRPLPAAELVGQLPEDVLQ
jgi:diguanylate cyclase (GGDEF)-like protein